MGRGLSTAVLLLGLVWPVGAGAQRSDAEALKLLDEVAQKYAKATRSHIESVSETSQSNELYTSWRKVYREAYEAPGNRYRFGGRSANGTGLVVSDGTAEWEFHAPYSEYVKRPAGTYGHPFPTVPDPMDVQEVRNAYFVRRNLGMLTNTLKIAHWKPDETIAIGDKKIACLVVSFTPQDYSNYDPNAGSTFEEKIWIDKTRTVIVKTEQVFEARVPARAAHGIAQHTVETVTYPVVSLDEPIPADAFAFTPPEDAKLVETFTDPFAKYRQSAPVAQQKTPPPKPNYVGTEAPNVTLTAADGSSIKLNSLRGKPVLIDYWATWCGPCLQEMPAIDRIYRYTKSAGLVVLGVDQDKTAEAPLAYLKKENYGWTNYHDLKDGKYTGIGVPVSGIPALLLIDAGGKIAYFHAGANDEPGLVAAVRRLGPAFAAAMDDAEK